MAKRQLSTEEFKSVNSGLKVTLFLTIFSAIMLVSLMLIGFFAVLPAPELDSVSESLKITLISSIGIIYLAIGIFYGYSYRRLSASFPDNTEGLLRHIKVLFIVSVVLGALNFSNIIGLIIFFGAAYYYFKAKEALEMAINAD